VFIITGTNAFSRIARDRAISKSPLIMLTASLILALLRWLINEGIAMLDKMASMAITTMVSNNEKPFEFFM
jgi:hypothetical protein